MANPFDRPVVTNCRIGGTGRRIQSGERLRLQVTVEYGGSGEQQYSLEPTVGDTSFGVVGPFTIPGADGFEITSRVVNVDLHPEVTTEDGREVELPVSVAAV